MYGTSSIRGSKAIPPARGGVFVGAWRGWWSGTGRQLHIFFSPSSPAAAHATRWGLSRTPIVLASALPDCRGSAQIHHGCFLSSALRGCIENIFLHIVFYRVHMVLCKHAIASTEVQYNESHYHPT